MATIENARITVSTDQNEQVYVSVSCDVQFTDFEVSAMNELGLQYRLQCQLINKDLWDVEIVTPGMAVSQRCFPSAVAVQAAGCSQDVASSQRSSSEIIPTSSLTRPRNTGKWAYWRVLNG